MDSKISVSLSNNNNNNKLNNNNSQLKQQQQNGHISLSFVEKINNNNNLTNTSTEKLSNIEKKPIRLNSPIGASAISWHWSEKEKNTIGIEVVDIIRLALVHFPDLAIPLKSKLESVDVYNYDQVRSLAKKFNKISKETALTRKENASKSTQNSSKELLHQIITRCYNRAVDNEKALNKHYEAFSSQTYGETSYERMQMIIEELKPTQKDVFVDLGSGVGQLVVHMAGGTQVHRAVGIEIASLPSKFAKKLEHEFKKLMNWFGRPFQPFELLHGDFLSTDYRKLITEEASIIFINNYAFQSDLETRIKRELLSDLKDGTKIVSTKPYVPLNKQGAITDRQLNDISVITEVSEMKPCPNPCSWTSAYVPYYLHTINRTKLENYFLKLRNSSLRAKSSDTGSRRSSTPNSSSKTSTNSRESSICCIRAPSRDKSSDNNNGGRSNNNGDIEEDYSFGPTTRRKWTEYVNEMEQQKRRQSSCSSGASGEKAAAAKAVINIKNSSSSSSTPLSNTTSQTSISSSSNNNNNIPKMLKIVKNYSNMGDKMGENDSNASTIPKLRLQQTTIKNENKNEEENCQNIIKINLEKITTKEKEEKLVENEAMEIVCNNSYNIIETTPKISETIPEENKNIENNNNNNEGIISPRFEPISPDKIATPTNNISNVSSNKQKSAKRSYERKERVNSFTKGSRGRPRKSADSSNILGGLHHHSSPKVPRLSEDARDGMELMHQMTCAIQMGKPMDAASILADLANQKANRQLQEQQTQNIDEQNNSCLNNKETPKTTFNHSKHSKTSNSCLLPFPQFDKTSTNINICKTSTQQQKQHQNNENENSTNNCCSSSKYPEINNFLETIKNAYENLFDEFQSKHQQNTNERIVIKEEGKEQQLPPPKEQQNFNNFHKFEQFRSILDSTPLKNVSEEMMEDFEEESGRRRISSLGEENLLFFSAESRQRFLSSGGTSETNVVFNKTPIRTSTTTMLQKKINNNLQQTPKTTTTSLFNKGGCLNKQQTFTEKSNSQKQQQRLQELQKRVEERRKWLLNAWTEFQREMQLFNTDVDSLVSECQQQQKQEEEEDSNNQQQQQQNLQLQQQLAIQLITQQQQAQHKLIEAAQAQLAIQVQQAQAQQQQAAVAVAASALNNNSSPNNNNNGVQQSSSNQATVNNQLDLLINEMRERYSQQLTAQHLLSQITQFGLLNTIAPQEIAALQSIASGAALNNVVHQLSPVAAAAAAAVVLQQQQQQLSPLSASASQSCPSVFAQQLQQQQTSSSPPNCLIPQNVTAPFVQNFLATLDNLTTENGNNIGIPSSSSIAINGDCSGVGGLGVGGGNSSLNISASLTNVSGDSANNSSNHSLNSSLNTSIHSNIQRNKNQHPSTPIGNSLQQVSQNFACQSQQQSQNKKSAVTVQHITRESTVAEVVAEVAALPSTSPRKPFKPRPTRNISSSGSNNKRSNQHSNKHSQPIDDPKKQEEIERQIQDIVAKALEVDSAAKSAEKDRKARVGEKRTSKEQQQRLCSIPTTSTATLDNVGKFAPLSSTSRNLQQNIDFQVKTDNAIMQNFLSAAVAASQHQQQSIDTLTNFDERKSTPLNEHFRSSSTTKLENVVVSPTQQHLNFNFTPSSVALAIQQGNVLIDVSSPSTCFANNNNNVSTNLFNENTDKNNKNTQNLNKNINKSTQNITNFFSSSDVVDNNKNNQNLQNLNKNINKSTQNTQNITNFFSSDVLNNASFSSKHQQKHQKQQTCSTTLSTSPPFISLNLPPNTCCNTLPPPTNVVVKVESKQPLKQSTQQQRQQ
ncbi:hypothetical protein ACQ4LE_006339 [Meloidogyne hapla]